MPGMFLVVAFVAALIVVGFVVLVLTPVAPLIVVLLAIPLVLGGMYAGGLLSRRSDPTTEASPTGPGTSRTASGARRPREPEEEVSPATKGAPRSSDE